MWDVEGSYAIKTTPDSCLNRLSFGGLFRNIRFTVTAVAAQTGGHLSHDALQRLLSNEQAHWSRHLWKRAKTFLRKQQGGYLIINDTVIGKDKDSWKTEMAVKFWSSSEKRYLYGQSVVLLIWTDGRTRVVLDIRFYVRGEKNENMTLL